MAASRICVLALICMFCLLTASWSESNTTSVGVKNEDLNAGEPNERIRMTNNDKKKNKKRNKNESKLEKKYKKKKNKKVSKKINKRIVTCPGGWTTLATGCYHITQSATFNNAKALCKAGGHLVEVNNQLEQDTLRTWYRTVRSWENERMWLGATDSATEGDWRWIKSGQSITINNWWPQEPNNAGGNEDCVVGESSQFKWQDIACSWTHRAICEYSGVGTGTTSDWSYCSSSSPCREKEGDCDRDSECAGSLVCGADNCKNFNPLAHKWADCCINKCSGSDSDWSCCSSTSPCEEKQGDCDQDSHCEGSLICGPDNCKDFNPLAHSLADCCIKECVIENRVFISAGNNVRQLKTSGNQECASLCWSTSGCVAWTMRTSDNYCWLKNKDSLKGTKEGWITGTKACGANNVCGIENVAPGTRISGGSVTGPNQYPWMVRLNVYTSSTSYLVCGGALITARHVLTAKHCVDTNSWYAGKAKVSVHNKDDSNDYQEIGIKEVVWPNIGNHDIAIAILDQAVDLNDRTIGTVCLPDSANKDYRGKSARAMGWGWTPETSAQSKFLQHLDLTVTQRQAQNWLWTDTVIQNGIPLDVCGGDSGGPLVYKENGRWTVIGTVQGGESCDSDNHHGSDGRWNKVTDHLDWIKRIIGN